MSSGSLEKCHTGSRWTLQEMQWESFLHWPTNVWECPSSVRLQDLSGWVTLVSSHFRIGCRKEAENQIVRKKIMQTLWRLNGESGAAVHLLPILNLADLEMVLKCLSSNWKCHLCTSGPSSSKRQKILTCSEWRGYKQTTVQRMTTNQHINQYVLNGKDRLYQLTRNYHNWYV